jgi:serine/threonine-protein kinase
MSEADPGIVQALADRYVVERELGRGGMAVVYLALDRRHGRRVAIKVLHRELAAAVGTERFLREIEIAAQLNHPHILPLLDSGTIHLEGDVDLPWFAMPFVEGESLRARLRREQRLPAHEALRLARELADALSHAHGLGVVHRDLKPENVLLSGEHAVLADFGVALALDAGGEGLTATGIVVGTPQYMSPEQLAGARDIDGRCDVYALGCVLHEMLTGKPPFAGLPARSFRMQRGGDIGELLRAQWPGMPRSIERVLTRALATSPADRHVSASELMRDLGTVQVDAGAAGRTRKFRVAGTLAGMGLLLMAIITAIVVLRGGPTGSMESSLVAVAPFDVVGSSDELLLWREGMVDLLSRNLDGAGPLRTVSPAAVIRSWRGAAHTTSAQELAERTGASFVVFGQLVAAGADSVRVVANLLDAAGRSSATDYELRGVQGNVADLADSLTLRLLEDLGRGRVVQTLRLRGGSRAPLPALKAFLQGEQLFRRASWDSALAAYERAVALDSTFTFALYRAGTVFAWLRLDSDSISRVYRFRAARSNHGLSPRDSLLVHADSVSTALYGATSLAWGERRRMIEGLEAATRRYPDDAEVWLALGEEGFHHGMDGGMREADVLAALDRAIEIDSSNAPAYVHAITLAYQLRDQAAGLGYMNAFLGRAQTGFQADGIRLALRLMSGEAGNPAELRTAIERLPPAGLFEGWAASQWSGDDGEAAVILARELVGRGRISAPQLANEDVRHDLFTGALLSRGHVRAALEDEALLSAGALAEIALAGALPIDVGNRTFGVWLSEGDARAVHGLEWWAAQRDTAALDTFRALCADGRTGAPCYGTFGAAAALAYGELARSDTAAALELFLGLPDTLCVCHLHRLTTVRLLHRFERNTEAAARLQSPLAGLLTRANLARVLWRLERGVSAERAGELSTAAIEYSRVLELLRRADPELADVVQRAEAGLVRARNAPRTGPA